MDEKETRKLIDKQLEKAGWDIQDAKTANIHSSKGVVVEFFNMGRGVGEADYVQKHLTKISRGVAIKNVPPMKDMKNIEFPIPSIEEHQIIIQNIEDKFSVIDKIEQAVSQSLSKAELLRKSILKSAFEGRLVKNG